MSTRKMPTIARSLLLACVAAAPIVAAAHNPFCPAPVRDPARRFQKKVCNWVQLKNRYVVMQKQDYSCGAASLATVLKYYWEEPVTEAAILDHIAALLTPEEADDRVENGLTLADLKNVADKAGYAVSVGELEINELYDAKVPLIVGIVVEGHEHFAVFRGIACGWVFLADPIRGNVRVPIACFAQQWQKNAALVVAPQGAKPRPASMLSVRPSEIVLGATNWQQVREFPSELNASRRTIETVLPRRF